MRRTGRRLATTGIVRLPSECPTRTTSSRPSSSSTTTDAYVAIDADLDSMVTPAFAAAARTYDDAGSESLAPDDAIAVWYDDCRTEDARRAVARLRPQSRRPLTEPSPLERWPDVPSTVVLARDDRCVNMEWAVAAAEARTGEPPTLVDGGHSPFLSRPAALAEVLDAIVTG